MKIKQQINEAHTPMKFDFNFSNKEINFFDTVVCKTHSSKLATKLYREEFNQQVYLHSKPEHPESLKQSTPFTQALSLHRICSTHNEFQDSCNKLRGKLIEREYKEQEINEGIRQAKQDFEQVKASQRENKEKK